MLRDTKNRSDHKLLLSRQALEIAERNCLDKGADDPLFAIVDARKTLAWINTEAGTTVQGHGLRATFASVAEELVSGGVLKRMLNHSAGGDVTLGHYVGKSEAQLRAGWQTVADFVEAAPVPAQSEMRILRVSARPSTPARRRISQKVAARQSAQWLTSSVVLLRKGAAAVPSSPVR